MYLGVKLAHVNLNQMEVFVMVNNVGIIVNAGVNVKNLIKM